MGSPLSPVVANLYMEDLETRAISTARHPPSFYRIYVDDSAMIIKSRYVDAFLEHLNTQDEHIKFTIEREEDGKLPILDSLLTRTDDGTINISVYRKPTHTEQYLSYKSCHPLEHNKSVVNTLVHRAKSIITKPEDQENELKHISQALKANGYPNWLIKQQDTTQNADSNRNSNKEHANKSNAVIPYVKGLSEKLRVVLNKHQISVAFKPHTTLRNILVHPKDKTAKLDKTGVVYKVHMWEKPNVKPKHR